MTNFTTSLLSAVARGENLDDLFCRELEYAINELLKTELTAFLDYEKYDPIGYNSDFFTAIHLTSLIY